ncbi:zinc finger, CCHC-type containing protein [Tanacetum coccineum]
MSSMQVLQGVEFEVKPQEDHTFEEEPHGNVDHVAEDSNEAAFAVAEAKKIYAHESLTFNNTVDYEVISKWKAGLKDDMDVRSNVYVLSNGCKKCSDDGDGFYWEHTPGDCDVEKNSKWSCIYAVGSQEYQMVCTRLHIAYAYVGMLDKFDRGLQIDVHGFVDFDYAMGRSITVMVGYMTLTEAVKEAIWLKGLAIESGFELKIVAGIAIGALSKAILDRVSTQELVFFLHHIYNKEGFVAEKSRSYFKRFQVKFKRKRACCTGHLLARRVLKMLEMDQEYLGNVEIAGGRYVLLLTLAFSEPPLAIMFLVLLRNVIKTAKHFFNVFYWIHGALDGGLGIPHSEKSSIVDANNGSSLVVVSKGPVFSTILQRK